MKIKIKRIYEPYEKSDGFRVLVDRLWPRGIKKETAHIDLWMKEAAPSATLRKWFDHDPEKWNGFSTSYKAELKGSAVIKELVQQIRDHDTATLLYGAKDEIHNQAVVLQQVLKGRLK